MTTRPVFNPARIFPSAAFVLFGCYSDILALQLPVFAILCPIAFVVIACSHLIKQRAFNAAMRRSLFGLPAVLLIMSVMLLALSAAHDSWLMSQVQDWGKELRESKAKSGAFPQSAVRTFHGYVAGYTNSGNPYETPAICFYKFNQESQCYIVPDDRFLPARDS